MSDTESTGFPPALASDDEGSPLVSVESSNGSLSPPPMYKYRDFGNINEDEIAGASGNDRPASPTPPARTNNGGTSIRVQKFPVKLYAILNQPEFKDIIVWMPHGRSWKVLKPNLFESLVMPLFFEYSNYHSFNRLINAWSFRRISSGPDRGSYYHELFLRGMPHLHKYMRRLPKTHKKLSMHKKDEPDFYKLDKENPLPELPQKPTPNGGAGASSAAMMMGGQQPQQALMGGGMAGMGNAGGAGIPTSFNVLGGAPKDPFMGMQQQQQQFNAAAMGGMGAMMGGAGPAGAPMNASMLRGMNAMNDRFTMDGINNLRGFGAGNPAGMGAAAAAAGMGNDNYGIGAARSQATFNQYQQQQLRQLQQMQMMEQQQQQHQHHQQGQHPAAVSSAGNYFDPMPFGNVMA